MVLLVNIKQGGDECLNKTIQMNIVSKFIITTIIASFSITIHVNLVVLDIKVEKPAVTKFIAEVIQIVMN